MLLFGIGYVIYQREMILHEQHMKYEKQITTYTWGINQMDGQQFASQVWKTKIHVWGTNRQKNPMCKQ